MNQEDLQTEEGVSRILPDTVVQAKMEAVKPVYLAGTVEGDVCCKSLLVIDLGGRVQGDVLCESLVLEGRIEGNVEAGHAVLAAGAEITGVLLAGRLEIAAGAKIGLGLKFRNVKNK